MAAMINSLVAIICPKRPSKSTQIAASLKEVTLNCSCKLATCQNGPGSRILKEFDFPVIQL